MGGNPKDSKWHDGGPRSARKRKKLEVTISDEAREKLERLADARTEGNKSAVVEELVMKAREP